MTVGSASKTTLEIGDKMPAGHTYAGWIYAGISKTTRQPFYAAPKDSGRFKWDEAMAFAARQDARVPSPDELKQLYEAREMGSLRETFNKRGRFSTGFHLTSQPRYWTGNSYEKLTPRPSGPWARGKPGAFAVNFSDDFHGMPGVSDSEERLSLRCVRGPAAEEAPARKTYDMDDDPDWKFRGRFGFALPYGMNV